MKKMIYMIIVVLILCIVVNYIYDITSPVTALKKNGGKWINMTESEIQSELRRTSLFVGRWLRNLEREVKRIKMKPYTHGFVIDINPEKEVGE